MHSPATPRLKAIPFFRPLPTHQSPTVFWLAEAIKTKEMIESVKMILKVKIIKHLNTNINILCINNFNCTF